MTNHISNTVNKTSTFSAPVVQSRLEHHHLQQLKQPEARQHQPHNRSKSLNRGKRGFSYNYHQQQQQTRETSVTVSSASSSTTTTTDVSTHPRHTNVSNKNFSNYNNNRVDNF